MRKNVCSFAVKQTSLYTHIN